MATLYRFLPSCRDVGKDSQATQYRGSKQRLLMVGTWSWLLISGQLPVHAPLDRHAPLLVPHLTLCRATGDARLRVVFVNLSTFEHILHMAFIGILGISTGSSIGLMVA